MARRGGRRSVVTAGLTVVMAVGIGAVAVAASAVVDPCNPVINPIVCENSKPGSPASQWDVDGAGDPTIQGFATDASVNVGETISFKIKTDADTYAIEIYRLGYYGGDGARLITTMSPSVSLPQSQPACVHDVATDLTDCGNWAVSASWTVPPGSVSGVYFARLVRGDTFGDSHIPFVVRDDSSTSDLYFKTSDATWQAYNRYGGADFYSGALHGRAYKLSYNRPYATRGMVWGRDFLFSNEYPMIRFLERNGYDVSYTTDVDADRRGHLIRNHKVFLSVGHDEYWSGAERSNVEAARDAGVHLAFFSGNEVYWRTRWESSVDGSNTPYRTLVCYKETWDNGKTDPSSEWTGTYRDPRYSPPGVGGANPENALTGTAYRANHNDLPIQVPAEQGRLRAWRNTNLQNLEPGQTANLALHTVGYESDEDLDNGFRPAGLIHLSTTIGPTPELLRDYGSVVTPGITEHHMTLYRAASGALVFSAGTIQFAWGLDIRHDGAAHEPEDPRLQQFVVNMFADMGVQPATIMAGLAMSNGSADTQAPTVTIDSPEEGSIQTRGAAVTLSGTATDNGGGTVAGVEVSTDGGGQWFRATGTSSWTYTLIASGTDELTVQVRAADDSANLSAPVTRTFGLTGAHQLFGAAVPKVTASTETGSIELGLRFKATTSGYVTGVRFYKDMTNTGTHTGSLWSSNGTRLATGTFTNETPSGWQSMSFAEPVPVTAGTEYVVSYRAPNGRYAADPMVFGYRDWTSGVLVAPKSSPSKGNGVFTYGNGMPNLSYSDTNYYVDVIFVAGDAPLQLVSTTPMNGAVDVSPTVNPAAAFTLPLDESSVDLTLTDSEGAEVSGEVGYNAAQRSITFDPSSALERSETYTATASGQDATGREISATWSFTTGAEVPTYTLFPTDAAPAIQAHEDPSRVELGVRFSAAEDGYIAGIRYYQGPGNTGPHIGRLWSASGTELASVTFPDSGVVGWQTALFDTPVPITAGTTYVASYLAPAGHYAVTRGFFTVPWSQGPLSAASDVNGVFRYGGGFPVESYQETNYWVDPLFITEEMDAPDPPPTPDGVHTLFPDTGQPDHASWSDPGAVELGVRFSSEVAATVTGIRFYKGAQNTGTHTGSLWSASGQLLATGTFTNESASGWQTLTFATPVAITPGTTYVASYFAPNGGYAVTPGFFASGWDNGVLSAASGANGVYQYGGGFPTGTYNSTNYWVDPIVVVGGDTPPPPPPPGPVVSIFQSSDAPANASWNDPGAVELGVKFSSSVAGTVTGVRFYKGPQNTGTHTGSLWSANGQLLATGTFTNESGSGWQTLTFATPVAITPGTTYVVSYFAPAGGYAVDVNYFSQSLVRGPLTIPAQGSVYAYGSGGFPTATSTHNYWVDVIIQT